MENNVPCPPSGGGEQTWRFGYASPKLGLHRYRTLCSDTANPDLHGQEGTMEVAPYEGTNPLFQHSRLRVAADRRHLEHCDGKPFFWLGDTWWMGFTKRLPWPEGFQELTADRVSKGFTLIQIVAGLYPDMEPFDERGANEAGFPWKRDFSCINPYSSIVPSGRSIHSVRIRAMCHTIARGGSLTRFARVCIL